MIQLGVSGSSARTARSDLLQVARRRTTEVSWCPHAVTEEKYYDHHTARSLPQVGWNIGGSRSDSGHHGTRADSRRLGQNRDSVEGIHMASLVTWSTWALTKEPARFVVQNLLNG